MKKYLFLIALLGVTAARGQQLSTLNLGTNQLGSYAGHVSLHDGCFRADRFQQPVKSDASIMPHLYQSTSLSGAITTFGAEYALVDSRSKHCKPCFSVLFFPVIGIMAISTAMLSDQDYQEKRTAILLGCSLITVGVTYPLVCKQRGKKKTYP